MPAYCITGWEGRLDEQACAPSTSHHQQLTSPPPPTPSSSRPMCCCCWPCCQRLMGKRLASSMKALLDRKSLTFCSSTEQHTWLVY